LKAQVDSLAAENSSLKTKADGLAAEAAQLRADRAKAQELFDKRQANIESKEKSLQQRLQTTIDSLRGNFIPCLNYSLPGYSFLLIKLCTSCSCCQTGHRGDVGGAAGLDASVETAEHVYQEVRSFLVKVHSTLDRVCDVSAPESMSTTMASVLEALALREDDEDPLIAVVRR
jgi:hypothetical protein